MPVFDYEKAKKKHLGAALTEFKALLAQQRAGRFDLTPPVARGYYEQKMAEFGVDMVLEHIASGRMPNEIALEQGWPITYFREWVASTIPPDRLSDARAACAETLMVQSRLCLLPDMGNAGAIRQKALSENLRWTVERLDPENWGPKRKTETAPPAVTITFDGMPDPLEHKTPTPTPSTPTPPPIAPVTIEAQPINPNPTPTGHETDHET